MSNTETAPSDKIGTLKLGPKSMRSALNFNFFYVQNILLKISVPNGWGVLKMWSSKWYEGSVFYFLAAAIEVTTKQVKYSVSLIALLVRNFPGQVWGNLVECVQQN